MSMVGQAESFMNEQCFGFFWLLETIVYNLPKIERLKADYSAIKMVGIV
jgi:hypothetical protein